MLRLTDLAAEIGSVAYIGVHGDILTRDDVKVEIYDEKGGAFPSYAAAATAEPLFCYISHWACTFSSSRFVFVFVVVVVVRDCLVSRRGR